MDYDICVIGAGPGGYVAAIRAAQLELNVAVIERATAGGICTSVGCIPSKTLLHGAGLMNAIRHAEEFGIKTSDIEIDFAKLRQKKDRVINRLVKGVEFLLKKNDVAWIAGEAKFVSSNRLSVTDADGHQTEISAKNFVIATGARPVALPHLKPDGQSIITYVEALEIDGPPGEFVVIGGGAIGLEMAEVYAAFGFQVTVIEMMPSILPGFDSDLCQAAADGLKKAGVTVLVGTKVTDAQSDKRDKNGKLTLTLESEELEAPKSLTADKVLVAVGLRPNSESLGLNVAGVITDERGYITVDNRMCTNIPNIFAIGDVTGKKLLAHKASREAHVAADNIAGHPATMSYAAVPGAVFLHPEIATVGMSEAEARDAGHDVAIGKFPMAALGRAIATGAADGFVKIVTDSATDQILGVHIVAPTAGDMIAEAALAMEMECSAEDLASTVHVHPTFAEALMESAAASRGEAVHIPNTK
jgi:dihydrolipoamide dehydrogenase